MGKETKNQEPPAIESEWLTRFQAAQYLQIGISTLDSRKKIKRYYLGKLVRFKKSDLDNSLEERGQITDE